MGRGLDGFDSSALCELRLRRGLTQAELAEKIGMRQSNICGLERGRQRPSVQTAHALAAALGVSPDALFTEPPANVLIRLRLYAGLTQREAAGLVGLPVSSYAELEQPNIPVPADIATQLAAALAAPGNDIDRATDTEPA